MRYLFFHNAQVPEVISMTVKTALAALALTLVPVFAYASCSARGHQAQSCAAGTVWDANQQTCIKQVNS